MKYAMPALLILALAGCQATRTAYYNAWEGMGYAKRERLVDDIKAARNEQAQAKQQFVSALEQFKAATNFKGGDLEKVYDRVNSEHKRSESRAAAVKDRIATVKNVAAALFTEWNAEIAEIKGDPSLQAQSQKLYDQTKSNYEQLVARMDKAAASMDPVLQKFRNRVLFLKANLNAQAIASLEGTQAELSTDVSKLIAEMEQSIREADEFIAAQQGQR
jgi:predicted enzyme involved in methoxymalonyl-ACP biosynthesis